MRRVPSQVSPPLRLAIALLGAALLLMPPRVVVAQAGGIADDRVIVLDWAPTSSARVLELVGAPPDRRVIDATRLELVDPVAPQVFTDVKVLPGGTVLMTGKTDASALLRTNDGQVRTLYTAENPEQAQMETATAVSYGALGDPTQLLIGDSLLSRASIREVATGLEPRRVSLFLPSGRGYIVQAIVLPTRQLAVAVNWPAGGVYGVELIDLDSAEDDPSGVTRIANKTHAGRPATLHLNESLDELRELMALDDETLLVSTRHAVFTMRLDGTEGWRIEIGGPEGLQGEIASARMLPTGRIAVATFEPGRWTAPHTNHRVYWFAKPADFDTAPALLERSDALERAPRRVEARIGTGGTGTFNFQAGLGDLTRGGLDDLEVTFPLTFRPNPATVGDRLFGEVALKNTSERVVVLRRATISALPGASCQSAGIPGQVFVERRDLAVAPGDTLTLNGDQTAGGDLFVEGQWCASVVLEDDRGVTRELDDQAVFTIQAGMTGPNRSEVIDLNLRKPGDTPDMGADMGDGGEEGDGSCQCRSAGARAPRTPATPLTLLVMGLAVGLRARRRAVI